MRMLLTPDRGTDSTDPMACQRRFTLPRRQFLAGTLGAVGAVALGELGVRGPGAPRSGTVAHADDSLLFQSPSLLQNIQSNSYVRTVHLTAGDDGLGESYWSEREAGMEAAYAQMAG